MTEKMNWPPSYADLTTEEVDIGIHLSTFLNVILSGKLAEIDSTRLYRIKMSLGQDLACNVSNGRIRTPKSVLFPYKYKMLTNNTELINMVNRLGQGICYSLMEEMEISVGDSFSSSFKSDCYQLTIWCSRTKRK